MCAESIDKSKPQYWEIQTESDRIQYRGLQAKFHEMVGKSRKGERLDLFTDRFAKIKAFVQRGDDNDWRRSLLCGVFFLNGAMAINIQQLRKLLGKCKSSINGSLQRLGYIVQTQSHEVEKEMLSMIPAPARDISELKKWTIRKYTPPTQEAPEQKPKFVIPIPANLRRSSLPVKSAEEMQKLVHRNFPCPIKYRYKYLDIISRPADASIHV